MANAKWHPYAVAGKCSVCGEDKDIVVFASILGAFSVAQCECCFQEDTQSLDMIDATIEVNGGESETAEWVMSIRERTQQHLAKAHRKETHA